jgi:ABC-type uncharacterized transport system ATPase subunit
MKEKRTYTKLKEHGEDMSHENEAKIKNDDTVGSTLPYLIEQHKKEIWEWKQKEADWIKTDNLFKGSQKIIEELSAKMIQQVRIISDLNYQVTKLKKELEDKNK